MYIKNLKNNTIILKKKNSLRSMNVCYGHSVIGKRKFVSLRKSNKNPDLPNFVPYSTLSKLIRDVNIGVLHPVAASLTKDLPEEELGEGMYRDLKSFTIRLANFILRLTRNAWISLHHLRIFQKGFVFIFIFNVYWR